MTLLFRIRPATPNIGNDAIGYATTELLRSTFGADTSIVDIPALANGSRFGGLTAVQVYDMNRLADGIVIGGGNLFENGQLTIDAQAVDTMRPPLLLIGLSHGRIHDRDGALVDRTDAMPTAAIRQLTQKAVATLVRGRATQAILHSLAVDDVEVGGCPTLFLDASPEGRTDDGRVLISVRHPARMSVPPAAQWRVADDVRRLVATLKAEYGNAVCLACHDYADLEFARGFPEAPLLYFDDAVRYLDALRSCRFNVTYRLHAFLPCLAFGTPSIHLSYDERGRDAIETAGMGEWDIDLLRERDAVDAVTARSRNLSRYQELRALAMPTIGALRATTHDGLGRFAEAVANWRDRGSDLRP